MNWERIIILCPSRETARQMVRCQEVDPSHPFLLYASRALDLVGEPRGRHYVDMNLYAAISFRREDAEQIPGIIRARNFKHLQLSELPARLKWIEEQSKQL